MWTTLLGVALRVVTGMRPSPALLASQSITTLTTEQISFFTPYTHYASAAYCTPTQTLVWDCGTNCNANPDFKPVASGGNGDSVQYWYVGYDPSLNTVIVSHQGTNPSEIKPLVTDSDFFFKHLDSTRFPGISSDVKCHSGFADEQELTAADVLAAVTQALSEYNTTSVTLVGHSLGAAIALLDSVYLPLWLPAGTTFQTICYGLPRVGNRAFANYVDTNLNLTHINNRKDPIPFLPTKSMGYVHPAGEVHIQDSGEWAVCPGQDNPSTECMVGDVHHIWDGHLHNHDGPYNGITMGCS